MRLRKLHKIDISIMRLHGHIAEGAYSLVAKRTPSDRSYAFHVRQGKLCILLGRHKTGTDSHCWQVIDLAETRPNYGGIRHWMICPWCESRCRVMYDGGMIWGDKHDDTDYRNLGIGIKPGEAVEAYYCRKCCDTGRARVVRAEWEEQQDKAA